MFTDGYFPEAPLISDRRRFSPQLRRVLVLITMSTLACLDSVDQKPIVKLTPATATILRGDTIRLVFLSGPEGEDPQNPIDIRWSSDNQVATVNSEGLVTGVALGSTSVLGIKGKE